MTRSTVAAIAAALCLAGFTGLRAQTQATPAGADIMPSLLAEVRGLRAAIEQMAAGGARVQLALGRLQLQEQRLNTILKRYEDTRTKLAEQQRSVAEQQEQMAMVESSVKQGGLSSMISKPGQVPSQEQVEDMQREMQKHFKIQLERTNAEILRLAGEEAVLAADVANEQARWTDLNQRLEELERGLARR